MEIRIQKKQLKVNLNALFWLILFIPFFEPGYFSQIRVIHYVYLFGKFIAFFLAIIKCIKSNKIPKFIMFVCVYLLLQLFSTIVNMGSINSAIYEILCTLGVVCVIYGMSIYNPKYMINCILLVFEFLIYANFVSVINAPSGLYIIEQSSGWWSNMCWFLGLRNGMTLTYVLAAFFEISYFYLNHGKLKSTLVRLIMFFTISTITIIKISTAVTNNGNESSAGGLMLAWGGILVYLALMKLDKMLGWFDFAKGVIVNYIFMILLVICRLQYLFSWIIVVLLKKDLTLTTRTYIWDEALEAIRKQWLIGYGVPSGNSMAEILKNSATVNTTQNGLLDVLFYGGILLFVVLILIFAAVSVQVKKQNLSGRHSFFIGYFIAVFLFATQSESIGGMRLFTILIGIWCIAPLLKETKEE